MAAEMLRDHHETEIRGPNELRVYADSECSVTIVRLIPYGRIIGEQIFTPPSKNCPPQVNRTHPPISFSFPYGILESAPRSWGADFQRYGVGWLFARLR